MARFLVTYCWMIFKMKNSTAENLERKGQYSRFEMSCLQESFLDYLSL
jgi:hypothetical protein